MPSAIKKKMLEETLKKMEGSALFFASFAGLSVVDEGELRRRLRQVAENVFMAKHTILRKALERMGAQEASALLEGSLILATTKKDPQVISKVLVEFAKDRESFKLRGAFIDGSAFQAAYVKALADLPSRPVLIASVLGGMKAPLTGFVIALNALTRQLVVALSEIQKKKG